MTEDPMPETLRMKTHRVTLSQNSNTLSHLSCDTNHSYYSDSSPGPDSDHNVSVSSLPGHGDQCPLSTVTTPSPDPNPDTRVSTSVPYRLNDVFYNEYAAEIRDRHGKRLALKGGESPVPSENDWDGDRGNQDVAISMEDGFNEISSEKIPGEPLKAIFSLIFLGVSWIASTSSLAMTHEFLPDQPPLPDIVLDNITKQNWALDVCEILLMMSIVAAVIVVVFHRHRFILLRRIWFLLGLLYFYRSITIFVTVLPKSDKDYLCTEKAGNITALLVVNRVVTLLSGGGLSINGKHVYCGDYIFSGHTVIFVMAYLCIKQYTPSRYYPLHWLSLLTSVCGVIFLLLARGHYTIDIVIAYALTYWLWITYHTLANIPILKTKHKDNQLKGLLWWHILRWFEGNISGSVPNEYSVPFWGTIKKCWRRCQSPPLSTISE